MTTVSADAHIHLFADGFHGRYGRPSSGGDDLAVYESLRATYGMEKALVVGYEGAHRYSGNNAYLAELARTRPWVAPAAFLPSWPAPTEDEVEALTEMGFVGVVLYVPTPEVAEQVARWPVPTLERIGQSVPVVSLNASMGATAALEGVVAALAPSTVLFSHLGLPGRFTTAPRPEEVRARSRPLLDLAGMSHVGVKISAMYSVSEPRHAFPHAAAGPLIRELVADFGPGRLFWGSDYSPALDWVSFAQTVDVPLPADLTDGERDAVMGGNLIRVLR